MLNNEIDREIRMTYIAATQLICQGRDQIVYGSAERNRGKVEVGNTSIPRGFISKTNEIINCSGK